MARDVAAEGVASPVAARARRSNPTRYLPIAEHGLIGDLHTVALVGTDGTIDWYAGTRAWSRSGSGLSGSRCSCGCKPPHAARQSLVARRLHPASAVALTRCSRPSPVTDRPAPRSLQPGGESRRLAPYTLSMVTVYERAARVPLGRSARSVSAQP
jgi:hypothetical protein